MITSMIVDQHGRVLNIMHSGDTPPGAIVYDAPFEWLPNVYRDGGRWIRMPEQPSEFHCFDHERKIWVPDIPRAYAAVRAKRDRLIAATDWRVTVAVESGQELAREWQDYRQALRDITKQPDPTKIIWPTPPDGK